MPELKLQKSEKMLDILAKVLQGSSKCVAVACVQGMFYIAANEFHKTMLDEDLQLKLIIKIMNYFKEVITTSKPDVMLRDEIMQDICRGRLYAIAKGPELLIPDNAMKYFITSRFLATNHEPLEEELATFQITDLSIKLAAANEAMLPIYGLICRLEDKIIKSLRLQYEEGRELPITVEQLHAFRNFQAEQSILHSHLKPKKGTVHAEMQILIAMLKNLANETDDEKKRVYIGTSIPCCFNCHCMMDAVNDVLSRTSKQIQFVTRGDPHDGLFENTWALTEDFTLSMETVFIEVKKQYEVLLKQRMDGLMYKKIFSMDRAYSDSDASDKDPEVKKEIYVDALLEKQKFFEKLSSLNSKNMTIAEHSNLLELCMDLNEKGVFDNLFKITIDSSVDEIEGKVDTFIGHVSSLKYLNDTFITLIDLNDDYFPDIYQKVQVIGLLRKALIEEQIKKQYKESFSHEGTGEPENEQVVSQRELQTDIEDKFNSLVVINSNESLPIPLAQTPSSSDINEQPRPERPNIVNASPLLKSKLNPTAPAWRRPTP